MTRHAYPTSAMLGDYLRAAAGLIPAAAMLATASLGTGGLVVVGGFAALFAVFGIRTALRHGTQIENSESVVRASGLLPRSILWSELDRMKLTYYSTRRDGRGGWMQLELRSGGSALRVDSRIEGFSELVEAAARAARMRGLSLSEATSTNLQALGVKSRQAEPALERAAGGAT